MIKNNRCGSNLRHKRHHISRSFGLADLGPFGRGNARSQRSRPRDWGVGQHISSSGRDRFLPTSAPTEQPPRKLSGKWTAARSYKLWKAGLLLAPMV